MDDTSNYIRDAYHLLSSQADSLDGELAAAHVKEVFEVWPEEVNDEDIVETLLTKVVYLRDPGWWI